ncbi:MAG TPA: HAMP domain-containing sensor histidine kinase [Patescibacteria group bacterium]|nr:HAMP domain-containing sensor histidine kinase [Patescibacteria group bacterium]
MKRSIRTKLFLSLVALVLFFVLMSIGLTLVGLEDYYIWQKKAILVANSKAIDDLYAGNPEEISLELERRGNTLGAGILILSGDGNMKYSSFGRIINQKLQQPFAPPPKKSAPDNAPPPGPPGSPGSPAHISKGRETIDDRTVLELQQDQHLRIDFLLAERRLNNGDTLILRQPLAPVKESVAATAQFTVFTGLLALLLGSLWAFVFAGRITLPIRELNRIAQSMAQLNFSQKCTINNRDEIGELGQSINRLSLQLDTAISELNQKNRQLMADVERERQLDKMRKTFVSSVSHELKTPLALILGYAEGLRENVAADEESRNFYCGVIIDEASKMDHLVKDLLNLSQIESGLFQLNRSDFDLAATLQAMVLKYQNMLKDKGVTVELQVAENTLVNGDVLRISQVLSNLFDNAITHAETDKTVKISVVLNEENTRVQFYNSGKPIPEESLEKIWTSFYKVDAARTRKSGGYGLGLSIVRGIQDLHGQSYGVENAPAGVTFWFDLKTTKIL